MVTQSGSGVNKEGDASEDLEPCFPKNVFESARESPFVVIILCCFKWVTINPVFLKNCHKLQWPFPSFLP